MTRSSHVSWPRGNFVKTEALKFRIFKILQMKRFQPLDTLILGGDGGAQSSSSLRTSCASNTNGSHTATPTGHKESSSKQRAVTCPTEPFFSMPTAIFAMSAIQYKYLQLQ
jgi:hypothetical protein